MKKYMILSAAFLTIIIFMIISVTLNLEFLKSIDSAVFKFVHSFRNPFLDYIMTFITLFGEVITILVLAVLSLFIPKNRKIIIPVLICLILSTLTNTVIKEIIQRERPDGFFLENPPFNYHFPSSFSFPSGHSQNGFLFYFLMMYVFTEKYNRKIKNKRAFYIGMGAVIFLIAFSRIYIGVHFFSDVLTGFLLGWVFILWFFYFFNKYRIKLFSRSSV